MRALPRVGAINGEYGSVRYGQQNDRGIGNIISPTKSDLSASPRLAIDGGPPAIKHPLPPMYPGGMRIGAEEEKAVLDVLRSKRLFRYYGPYSGASRVDEFEKAFAAYMGTGHAVAVSSG